MFSHAHIQWVDKISRAAKTGHLQLAIVAVSVLLIARNLLGRSCSKISRPEGVSSKISIPFELSSQVFRASALGFMVVAALRESGKWTNVAVSLIS